MALTEVCYTQILKRFSVNGYVSVYSDHLEEYRFSTSEYMSNL